MDRNGDRPKAKEKCQKKNSEEEAGIIWLTRRVVRGTEIRTGFSSKKHYGVLH